MKKFTGFLEKYLSPLGAKLGNQRHLQALSNGMMMTLPLLVIGSIFMILNNPPINLETVDMNTTNLFIRFLINWKEWAVANSEWILAPYNMTFGMLGLMTAFSVAYCLAKSYKMNAAVNGIMSMSVFLLVCSKVVQVPVGEDAAISAITSQYLTSDGLFIALVLSFVCVEINRMVDKLGIKVKFPASVPSMVATFVNSLLPLFVNIVIVYGINLILISLIGKSIPEAIMSLLTPAIDVGNNIWVYAGIIMFSNILWFFWYQWNICCIFNRIYDWTCWNRSKCSSCSRRACTDQSDEPSVIPLRNARRSRRNTRFDLTDVEIKIRKAEIACTNFYCAGNLFHQ